MSDYRTHERYLALLAACRATPADDLPRLVLADWLDESGEGVRAKQIRDGCANPATLQFRHPHYGPLWPGRIEFTRGFASLWESDFAEWVAHADQILPESVGLTVRLTTLPEAVTGPWVSGPYDARWRAAAMEWQYGEARTDVGLDPTPFLRLLWPDVAAWELPPEPRDMLAGRTAQAMIGNTPVTLTSWAVSPRT